MEDLFEIQCKNCGAPVGYDIVRQTYRCPHCGEISGIQEVREAARFRRLNHRDRSIRKSVTEVLSCPGCGAEILCQAGEGTQVCSFCGNALVRREFEESDQFPEYIIPFTLTEDEARQRLEDWAEQAGSEGRAVKAHLQELQGWYLPYILVRGPVRGFVLREHVNREFSVRGYLESTTVSTSRQLDNEALDGAEPFDLQALRPFEHGFLAGHRVKLPDLSAAKRQRRTLQEASRDLKAQLTGTFHTQGIRVHLEEGELLEMPVLLPMYILKMGRQLAVVNGQTGRVAVKTDRYQKRSLLWMLEPAALMGLILLFMTLLTGSVPVGLIAGIPLFIAIAGEYQGGRFSVFDAVIRQSRETRAVREKKVLKVEEQTDRFSNPFPITPIFQEQIQGEATDVIYRFYPLRRVLLLLLKTLGIYFLPCIISAVLRFGLHLGQNFRIMGCVPWFWCVGIFCVVYFFTGIRCDAYEKPYVYLCRDGKKGPLTGSSRSLPFLASVGLNPGASRVLDAEGLPPRKLKALYGIAGLLLLVSILSTIL